MKKWSKRFELLPLEVFGLQKKWIRRISGIFRKSHGKISVESKHNNIEEKKKKIKQIMCWKKKKGGKIQKKPIDQNSVCPHMKLKIKKRVEKMSDSFTRDIKASLRGV